MSSTFNISLITRSACSFRSIRNSSSIDPGSAITCLNSCLTSGTLLSGSTVHTSFQGFLGWKTLSVYAPFFIPSTKVYTRNVALPNIRPHYRCARILRSTTPQSLASHGGKALGSLLTTDFMIDYSQENHMGQQDWKLDFVQRRVAKLLLILDQRFGTQVVTDILRQLGDLCASEADQTLITYCDNFPGYCTSVKQSASADNVTYNPTTKTIIMASDDRTDCFCPLMSLAHATPETACNCSLGWQKHTWRTLLQKEVGVELRESVLRGGKRCVFEIKTDGGITV